MKHKVFSVVITIVFTSCSFFKQSKTKAVNFSTTPQPPVSIKVDTTKKSLKPKPYKDVITSKAITDYGLLKVHRIADKYYFEIPDSLLERDLFIVSRLAKAPAEGGMLGGEDIGGSVVRFSKGPNDKVFMKRMSYVLQSKDSSENGLHKAFQNSSMQPIVASFDVAAYSPDSTAEVIDATKFLESDNTLLYFASGKKNHEKLGAMDPERSYLESVKSFPLNLEISSVKTYASSNTLSGIATCEINTSIVLLPKTQMEKRYYDGRVGYFYREYGDFDINPQGYETPLMVSRWRLEPRPEEIEKYKRGELVEPLKPIIYYIDPATPKKWVPYLIQGVNDWQKAFEKAGFKNAIYALEAPLNDTTWNLFDARHNAIIYKASGIQNAAGPHIEDPRSGEIIETHIEWYHNVMKLIHDWYMIQAGPNDPRARKMQFDDHLMGQLIRFVCSHEVGHTLGLQHNFGSSSTIPTEKLREKKWVEENGFCPSIMDYARFNYVAQPEDSISEKGLLPRIGVYDEFAIEWGYRWFDHFKTREQEETYLNRWVTDKTKKDARLFFGSQLFNKDPRSQSEDLGDDAVLSGSYGLRNLKRVVAQLPAWTKEPNQNYNTLSKMRYLVFEQYKRYIRHVALNIAGININPKVVEELPEKAFTPTAKAQQQSALKFLADEILVKEPTWFNDFDGKIKYFSLIGGTPPQYSFSLLRDTLLGSLLSNGIFQQLSFFEESDPDAYSVKEYLRDMEAIIWGDLSNHKKISAYERYTEQSYISKLINALNYNAGYVSYLEIATLVKLHAQAIYKRIRQAIPYYTDELIKTHLIMMEKKLKKALDGDSEKQAGKVDGDKPSGQSDGIDFRLDIGLRNNNSVRSCFDNWLNAKQ